MNQDLNYQNQNSNLQEDSPSSWLPNEIEEIRLQANQVAKTESGWQQDKHQEMDEVRKLAATSKMNSVEGTQELELKMRNLGMPGVTHSGQAFNLLDQREEAMMEERALQEQDQSYLKLSDQKKQQAEARIYNGYNFRLAWRGLYDYILINHQNFELKPTTPVGEEIKKGLKTLVANEIRLAIARDSRTGLDYTNDKMISDLSAKFSDDPEFIKFLNEEKSYFPNTTNIKFEIEKRIRGDSDTEINSV